MSESNSATSTRLSVALIVRDAEAELPSTLESIQQIADQVVVLDTGSTDSSRDVAARYGADVVEHPWRDDFAAARNACLEHLNGDWVLWLDAGETVDSVSAKQLREFVERDADRSKAYMLFIRLPSPDARQAGEQIGRIRLIPRDDRIHWTGRVREAVLPSLLNAGLEVDALCCPIERSHHDFEPARKQAKARRNLELARVAEKESGELVAWWLVRGEAHQDLGDSRQAASCFRRAIGLAEQGSSEMLEAYYGLLASYDSMPEEKETQITLCLEALDIYPLDAQLLAGMGSYLLSQQRLDLAARSYEIAATHGQVDPTTWHLADIAEVAANCLALVHQLREDLPSARFVLQRALNDRPQSLRLRRQLLELLIKTGDRESALAEFEKIPRETPHREALRSAVRGALLAVDRNWLAAEPYLQTAYTSGCRDPLCLRWLTVVHLALGRLDEADLVLGEWRVIDPQSAELAGYEQAVLEQHRESDQTSPVEEPADRARSDKQVRIDAPSTPGGVHPPLPALTPSGTPTSNPALQP